MKIVTRKDKKGYLIATKLRDSDSNDYPEMGLPVSVDLRDLDWESLRVELNNKLVETGLLNWEDVMKSQSGVTAAILSVIRPKIIRLYRDSFRQVVKETDK